MQAIRTTILGPTETLPMRVKATAAAGSRILMYDHGQRHDLEYNHRHAAEALAAKLGWLGDGYGEIASGSLPDGSHCHVFYGRDGKGG